MLGAQQAFVISVVLNLKNNLTKGFKAATLAVRTHESALKDLNSFINKNLAVAFTGLTSVLALSVKAASDFEFEMFQSVRWLKLSSEGAQELRDHVMNAARNTNLMRSELAAAANALMHRGLGASSIENLSKAAYNLKQDLKSLTDITVNVAVAYDMSSDDVLDKIMAIREGGLKLEAGTATVFNKLVQPMRDINIAFDEMASVFTALKVLGGFAEDLIGVGLRHASREMTREMSKVNTVFKEAMIKTGFKQSMTMPEFQGMEKIWTAESVLKQIQWRLDNIRDTDVKMIDQTVVDSIVKVYNALDATDKPQTFADNLALIYDELSKIDGYAYVPKQLGESFGENIDMTNQWIDGLNVIADAMEKGHLSALNYAQTLLDAKDGANDLGKNFQILNKGLGFDALFKDTVDLGAELKYVKDLVRLTDRETNEYIDTLYKFEDAQKDIMHLQDMLATGNLSIVDKVEAENQIKNFNTLKSDLERSFDIDLSKSSGIKQLNEILKTTESIKKDGRRDLRLFLDEMTGFGTPINDIIEELTGMTLSEYLYKMEDVNELWQMLGKYAEDFSKKAKPGLAYTAPESTRLANFYHENQDDILKIQDRIAHSFGKTEAEFEKNQQLIRYEMDRTMAYLSEIGIRIGQSFFPVLQKLLPVLEQKLLPWLENNFIPTLEQKLLPTLEGIADWVTKVNWDEIGKFAIDIAPVLAAGVVISKVIVWTASLISAFNTIAATVGGVGAILVKHGVTIGRIIEIVKDIGYAASIGFGLFLRGALSVAPYIAAITIGAMVFRNQLKSLVDFIVEGWERLRTMGELKIPFTDITVWQVIYEALHPVYLIAVGVLEILQNLGKFLVGEPLDFSAWARAVEGFYENTMYLFDEISKLFGTFAETITNPIQAGWNAWKSFTKPPAITIFDTTSEEDIAAIEAFSSRFNTTLKEIPQVAIDVAEDFVDALDNGMSDLGDIGYVEVKSWAAGIRDATDEELGIMFREAGREAVKEFGGGFATEDASDVILLGLMQAIPTDTKAFTNELADVSNTAVEAAVKQMGESGAVRTDLKPFWDDIFQGAGEPDYEKWIGNYLDELDTSPRIIEQQIKVEVPVEVDKRALEQYNIKLENAYDQLNPKPKEFDVMPQWHVEDMYKPLQDAHEGQVKALTEIISKNEQDAIKVIRANELGFQREVANAITESTEFTVKRIGEPYSGVKQVVRPFAEDLAKSPGVNVVDAFDSWYKLPKVIDQLGKETELTFDLLAKAAHEGAEKAAEAFAKGGGEIVINPQFGSALLKSQVLSKSLAVGSKSLGVIGAAMTPADILDTVGALEWVREGIGKVLEKYEETPTVNLMKFIYDESDKAFDKLWLLGDLLKWIRSESLDPFIPGANDDYMGLYNTIKSFSPDTIPAVIQMTTEFKMEDSKVLEDYIEGQTTKLERLTEAYSPVSDAIATVSDETVWFTDLIGENRNIIIKTTDEMADYFNEMREEIRQSIIDIDQLNSKLQMLQEWESIRDGLFPAQFGFETPSQRVGEQKATTVQAPIYITINTDTNEPQRMASLTGASVSRAITMRGHVGA